MTEQSVTYLELKLPKSKTKKDRRNPAPSRRESRWRVLAASLGVLCLFLLLAAVVLGYKYSQLYQECKNGRGRNDTSSTEDHSNLPTYIEKGCDIRHGQWSCCGRSCYYFSTEEKTWEESKTSCQQLGYHLIKIDDEWEQSERVWVSILRAVGSSRQHDLFASLQGSQQNPSCCP